MGCVGFAPLAVFFNLKSIGRVALRLRGLVVAALANLAGEGYTDAHISTGHIGLRDDYGQRNDPPGRQVELKTVAPSGAIRRAPITASADGPRRSAGRAAVRHPGAMRSRTLILLWVTTWTAFLCVGMPLAVLPRYVHGPLGGNDLQAGIAVGALSLAAMLVRPISGRLADERSRRVVIVGGMLACVVGGALLLVVHSYLELLGARAVVGAGEAAVYAASMAWALDLTPAHRHGSAIAWFGMAIWLGAVAGTATGELLLDATGGVQAGWIAPGVRPPGGVGCLLAHP